MSTSTRRHSMSIRTDNARPRGPKVATSLREWTLSLTTQQESRGEQESRARGCPKLQ